MRRQEVGDFNAGMTEVEYNEEVSYQYRQKNKITMAKD